MMTAQDGERLRARLVDKYIKDPSYSNVVTQSAGVNHLAFYTDKVDETIEFYTKIVGLKLLRIRPLDGRPDSTMIFFDLGRNELLAFLYQPEVHIEKKPSVGGVSHFAITITDQQYDGFRQRAESHNIHYRSITHEILKSISAVDPNGLEVELSVWNMDPNNISQVKEVEGRA